jgi:tripartite-type tricarboxylate transporter receptor subunit TctC
MASKVIAVLLALFFSATGWSQQYPSKPIRFIVPTGAGSNADTRARYLAPKLAQGLGQPIVVENRAGAENIIGAEAAYKAAPDGYTIIYATAQFASINPWLYTGLPYDADKFVPVTLMASTGWFVATHAGVPAKTLADVVKFAKANPGQLAYASTGPGSYGYLLFERIKALAGVDMTEVPFKNTGAELSDLISGRVQIGFNTWTVYGPHFKSGKLVPLAVALPERLSIARDIPTIGEAGYSGLEMNIWGGVLAPPGTPMAIVNRLQAEFSKVIKTPEVFNDIAQGGAEPSGMSPAEFGAFLRNDRAQWGRIIQESKLKPKPI